MLQGDIPLSSRPYQKMAEHIGITEDEFLGIVQHLDKRGLIRRFGATLKHKKSGFTANAMVAWNVPEERVQEIGSLMASFQEITHCYRRDPAPEWPYNMYTMVHARTKDQCLASIRKISQTVHETDYTVLFSLRELKKTSMVYFSETQ